MNNGQWFVSRDGHDWWFDSGALSLDFAYTGSMADNPLWEKLHSPEDLVAWLAARFERLDESTGPRELIDALALRSAIGSVALAISRDEAPTPDAIDTINLFAATPNIPPSLAGGNRRAGRSSVRVGQTLSTIARDAIALFDEESHDRIRQCAADDCELVFFDESRSNNRRWCSMQRCGNRSKVRAHRARTAG
jgi:predicted RNA-binding Zn ribbon-like protein